MHRLGHVASKLNVRPGLVQRWTRDYADWLSDDATTLARGADGRFEPRRYSDADIEILQRLKVLDTQGLSPHEIRARLASANGSTADLPDASAPVEGATERYSVSATREAPRWRDEREPGNAAGSDLVSYDPPSGARHLLEQTRDSQQALLAAHNAQRELLNAMIESATALKSENTQLRKRLRMMEEQMSRLQESDWSHRVTLEERMNQLEQELAEAKGKRPWWQRLFGG